MSDEKAAGEQFDDDDEPTRGPRLADVIKRHVRAALATEIHVAIPASVTKVHTDTDGNVTQVDVAPGVHDFYRDEGGALLVSPVPVIANVPIGVPGAGNVRLTLPIQEGDLGVLTFMDRSIDRWLSGDGHAVDPEIYTRWNKADALFTPGMRPFGKPWEKWPSDHATLGEDGPDDGSHMKIHFRPSVICIGPESGAKNAARKGDRESASANMATWMGQVEGFINGLAPGTVAPLSGAFATVGPVPPASGIAVIDEGSDVLTVAD